MFSHRITDADRNNAEIREKMEQKRRKAIEKKRSESEAQDVCETTFRWGFGACTDDSCTMKHNSSS